MKRVRVFWLWLLLFVVSAFGGACEIAVEVQPFDGFCVAGDTLSDTLIVCRVRPDTLSGTIATEGRYE